MKNSTILGALLIVSVAVNVYLWIDKDDNHGVTCYSTPGFEPPKKITKEEADMFREQYRQSLTGEDKTEGGLITRSSLDEILCTKDCNAITYSFGRDKDAKTGPAGNGVFVILSGVNVKVDSNDPSKLVVQDLGIQRYVPRYWCPPICN